MPYKAIYPETVLLSICQSPCCSPGPWSCKTESKMKMQHSYRLHTSAHTCPSWTPPLSWYSGEILWITGMMSADILYIEDPRGFHPPIQCNASLSGCTERPSHYWITVLRKFSRCEWFHSRQRLACYFEKWDWNCESHCIDGFQIQLRMTYVARNEVSRPHAAS